MNFKSLTQKKWGLPLWAWGLIAVAFLFMVYYFVKKRKTTASANLTPLDAAGSAAQNPTLGADNSGGGGGSLGTPSGSGDNPLVNPNDQPLGFTPFILPTPVFAPPVQTPPAGAASPVRPSGTATKSLSVSPTATATSLQPSVLTPNTKAVFVPKTATQKAQLAHPASVKLTANKTGGSANRVQGVFAIH